MDSRIFKIVQVLLHTVNNHAVLYALSQAKLSLIIQQLPTGEEEG